MSDFKQEAPDFLEEAVERFRAIAGCGSESLERWCYKSVSLTWLGVRCDYGLSHAAFSSDRIDDGSKRLLDALAARIEATERRHRSGHDDGWNGRSVYDIGCGVGVLGIAAAASLGADRLVLEDRDSFSVALACLNAWRNRLSAEIVPNSAPTGARSFAPVDLVLCNIPAKAGASIHRLMLQHAVSHLLPGGLAGFVVVRTLAASVERNLDTMPVRVERIDGPGHTVFIVDRVQARDNDSGALTYSRDDEASYLRDEYVGDRSRFQLAKTTYSLNTIEGLPEFDGPSYMTRMLVKLGLEYGQDKHVLAVDDGPGHLAAALSPRCSRMCCASRNALAAYAHEQLIFGGRPRRGKRNGISALVERPAVLAPHVPQQGLIVLPVVPEPYTPVFDELQQLFERISEQRSQCIVAGNSSAISRLEKLKLPLSIRRRAKSRGVRGLVLAPF